MTHSGCFLAVALALACGTAHAADAARDPLTTPNSPLYQPSQDVRAQVREVMGQRQPRALPAAAYDDADGLPALGGADNPVPRSLVAVAQRELAALGYDPGAADGRMGPRTRKALMAFQADKGLPADGKLTFELVNKLMVRSAPADTPAAAPPPAAPAAPAVVSFNVRRALGKTVHAQSGDLLGRVGDFVVGADRTLTGVVVDTTNGYGTDEGKAVVPFAQVGHAITRVAVILPLPAHQALPLRDKPQKVELSQGQWLLSTALAGTEAEVLADTEGKLLSAAAQAPK